MPTVLLGLVGTAPDGSHPREVRGMRWTRLSRGRTGDDVIVKSGFTVALTGAGDQTVVVAPTGPSEAWRVEEVGSPYYVRHVVIPDTPDVVPYADLADVDPATLAPTAEPVAAWWAALEAGITGGEAWAGEAQAAAVTATAARDDAVDAAGEATEARDGAVAASDRAEDAAASASLGSVGAYPDPDDPDDVLILDFPAFLLHADETSVVLPIGATHE